MERLMIGVATMLLSSVALQIDPIQPTEQGDDVTRGHLTEATPASPDANSVCAVEQQRLADIQSGFGPSLERLQLDSEELSTDAQECDAYITLGKCSSKDVDWRFHRPVVRMNRQEWTFDTVKVYSNRETLKYDVPRVTSKIVEVGKYKKCHRDKLEISCSWHPITMSKPEFHSDTKSVSFDIPQFEWGSTSVSLHVPEISMEEELWKFKWFSCPVKGAGVNSEECKAIEGSGNELQDRSQRIASDQINSANTVIIDMNRCQRTYLLQQREDFVQSRKAATSALDSQIESVRNAGGDPRGMRTSDGGKIDLVAQRDEFETMAAEALNELDAALRSIDEREMELFSASNN